VVLADPIVVLEYHSLVKLDQASRIVLGLAGREVPGAHLGLKEQIGRRVLPARSYELELEVVRARAGLELLEDLVELLEPITESWKVGTTCLSTGTDLHHEVVEAGVYGIVTGVHDTAEAIKASGLDSVTRVLLVLDDRHRDEHQPVVLGPQHQSWWS